ncbi:integrase [Mycobacterium phage ridax]|nr:integrase [Mycobacterium phage ridax]
MVNRWRTWQFAQSLSRRTVEERVATVRRMAEWCGVSPEFAQVEQIVEWLAEGGTWSARTRWTYYGALSAWFLWLQQQGYRQDNPMVMIGRPKRPKSVPRPVSNLDMQRLLAVRAHKRTKAMILLAAFQGLRVHEIAQVKGEHLDLIERTMTVTGKGNITATLPLHHRVVEMAYQMPRKGHWFPGPDRGHQRRESVSGTIKEAMIRAGVLGSAHCLRHWFGTALLEAGVDLRTVQELMRHQSLTSTEIYTRVTDQRRAEGIQRLDPFGVARQGHKAADIIGEMIADEVAGSGASSAA